MYCRLEDGEKDSKMECLNEKLLRRSLRFSLGLFGTPRNLSKTTLQMVSSQIMGSLEKGGSASAPSRTCDAKLRASRELEAKPLLLSWHEDDRKPLPVACYDLGASGEQHLRRSPRFILAAENGINNESSRKSVIKLSDENKFRSSRHLLPLTGAESIEANFVKRELSDFPDEQPSKRVKTFSENSSKGMSDEKFLRRSPRLTISFFGAENSKMKCALSELPVSVKKHSPKKNLDKEHSPKKISSEKKHKSTSSLVGDPIPDDEAQERWRWRYEKKVANPFLSLALLFLFNLQYVVSTLFIAWIFQY